MQGKIKITVCNCSSWGKRVPFDLLSSKLKHKTWVIKGNLKAHNSFQLFLFKDLQFPIVIAIAIHDFLFNFDCNPFPDL